MKRIGIILATVAMAMLMPLSAVAKESPTSICNTYEWEVLKIVNQERMANKLQPISMFKNIQKATGVRTQEIKKSFSHTRPDGRSCFTALSDYNVAYMWAGENIAAGYRSPSDVMNGWMNSPGHRANILHTQFDHIGIGYDTGGSYGTAWVQMFAGGCSTQSIKVAGDLSKVKPGMTIDEMNLYLEVTCSYSNHGTSYCPIIAKMCKGYDPNKTTGQVVTVEYDGLKTTFNVGAVTKAPKVTGLKTVTVGKNAVKINWKKASCAGYQVYLREGSSGSFKLAKTLTSASKTTTKITGLKSGKTYYIKMRSYVLSGKKKIYGSYCSAIKFRTSK